MKYIPALLLTLLILFSSAVNVNAAPRQEALNSGYHTTLFTSGINSYDDGAPTLISVYPFSLQIGRDNVVNSLYIRGDGSGNFTFDLARATSRFVFLEPVNINSVLLVQNGVNALRYCDLNGQNCINGATIGGMYTNISNLQAQTNGMYNNISLLQAYVIQDYINNTNRDLRITRLEARVDSINASVIALDGRVTTIENTVPPSLPLCVSGQYMYWDGATWTCNVPAAGASIWTKTGNNINYTYGNVGIGVSNPTQRLDVNGNIGLSGSIYYGTVESKCLGTAIQCDSLSIYQCNDQIGCFNACYNADATPFDCASYTTQATCIKNPECLYRCTGFAAQCSGLLGGACTQQRGCTYSSGYDLQLSSSGTSIQMPKIDVGVYCDSTGTNCVKVTPVDSREAETFNGYYDSLKELRRGSSVTCPNGYYLSGIRVVNGEHSDDAYLRGDCKKLPIQ
jgi:hypothetical protein